MKKVLLILLAAMLLATAVSAFAEETAETQEPQIFEWGTQGNVELILIGECTEELKDLVQGTPEGKWIVVEFQILDGAEMNTNEAFDYAQENVTLDDFAITHLAAQGVKVDNDFNAVLIGTIVLYFDVPEDYDITQGTVTINGIEAEIPVFEEDSAVK